MARAAKAAGVSHVIWSTLEDTREHFPLDDNRMPTLMGSYKVPHFDAKAEADQFFLDAGVPTTLLRTTFFWENLLTMMAPQRGADGKLTLALAMGDSELAGVAAEDIGKTAHGIFKRGTELVGRTVSIAGEHMTGAEIAAVMSKVLGEEVVYVPVPFDAMRAQPWPGAVEAGKRRRVNRAVPATRRAPVSASPFPYRLLLKVASFYGGGRYEGSTDLPRSQAPVAQRLG